MLVSGGLGPTHDDRTVELVAKALGVGLHVEPELEAQIEAVSRAAAVRLRRDYADFAPGVTKQATVPDGAISLGLAGTAPGLLVPRDGGRLVVVLPGPPSELQRLWPNALETDAFRALLARARAAEPPGAAPLRRQRVGGRAGARRRGRRRRRGGGDDLRARLRDPRRPRRRSPAPRSGRTRSRRAFLPPLEQWLYGRDERGVEEHVLELCRARGYTLATAESCTGGLVAARLTSIPGSSDVVLGGIVAYANEVKRGGARRPGGAAGASTAPCPPRSRRRWRAAPASGSAPTSRSR